MAKAKRKINKDDFLLSVLNACDTVDADGKRTALPATVFLTAIFQGLEEQGIKTHDDLRESIMRSKSILGIIDLLASQMAEFLNLDYSDEKATILGDSLLAAVVVGAIAKGGVR